MNSLGWFGNTFDPTLARSQVEAALAPSIEDVIQDMAASLMGPLYLELTYIENLLKKTQTLFHYLDAQSGHAALIQAFQQAALQRGGINHMLNPLLTGNQLSNIITQDRSQFIRHCPLPTKFFQGREDILSQLRTWFQLTQQKQQRVVLLHGLGGVGKTQIALKFIAESGSRFTHHFKINASSGESIQAGYKEIAMSKNLGDTVNAAQTWLNANPDEWLILFDNADKVDLDLGDYLPKGAHGNILITSRNPDLWVHTGPDQRAIEILNLSVDDAVSLLLKRAGLGHNAGRNKIHAGTIVKELLYCFPLAIVQAGAFISKSAPLRQDMSKFIPIFQQNKTKILSETPDQSSGDYKLAVYTTWQMSFAQLSSKAAQFLQLCSFIHFEGIREDIFQRAAEYKPDDTPLDPTPDELASSFEFLQQFKSSQTNWDSFAFGEMMGEICGYSLMTWHEMSYSVHPLVHQWARTTISDPTGCRNMMVSLLGMATTCSRGVVQNIQLLLHLLKLSESGGEMGSFELMFAVVYYAGGHFRQAETYFSSGLRKSTVILGSEHPRTVSLIAYVARTYHSLGYYMEAEKLKQEVLAKRTQLLGAEHPHTIEAMADLSVTYHSLGRYLEAEKLKQQVLTERTRLLGAEHPNTIEVMASLSVTYHSLEQYVQAEKLQQQVLGQRTRLRGPEHPDTIRAVANLSATYHSLGRYLEAEKLQQQVLAARTRLFGAEHPDTIRAVENLSGTYHSLGRYMEAEKLDQQVLAARTRLLGAEHPDTIEALANLSVTYHSLGRYLDAEKLKQQVLAERIQLLGAEHPDTIRAVASLSATYYAQGRYMEAEKLNEQLPEKQSVKP
ncbi:P-loop containing nucleoside triphosphate hydrolase protein [Mycena amicta]|nr:P-loop containing nucleoside triphosphate hydrolase protein [Mycena amicta]